MTSTSDPFSKNPEKAIEEAYRTEWGRLLSKLVPKTRRLDLAEEALGEAFAKAAERWPTDGVPDNPPGWLYTTAHRQVLGWLRTEAIAGRKAPLLVVRSDSQLSHTEPSLTDHRLHLILLCCHPSLQRDSRSALALRLVIGTPTEQIARLFLVPTTTMAARLTRAKKKIVVAGIPLGAPPRAELVSRLDEVCRTIYLAFTAGYTPGSGPDLLRSDLAGDAVALAAVLHELVPTATQVQALYSLLLLQHSRRKTRERDGRLVTLADQNRSLWDLNEIGSGVDLVSLIPVGSGYAEELRLQALIAAEHATARYADATDWSSIASLYARLESLTQSAVVRLNRAVAVAENDGPQAGLALLAELDDVLPNSHRLAAVRAEIARRAGDRELALASYRIAIESCANDVERSHFVAQLEEIEASSH